MMELTTKHLTYRYSAERVIAFGDLTFEKGEQYAVLGPSGCGKTTLLHLMAGLLAVQEGEIWLDGTPMHTLSGSKLDRFRAQKIGIVFQRPHFIAALTLAENLMMAQKLAQMPTDTAKAHQMLERLGLSHKANSLPAALSQGEMQRASIGRALMNAPSYLFADEPTSALDDANCQNVLDLLKTYADEAGAALIVVTHDNRVSSLIKNQIVLT